MKYPSNEFIRKILKCDADPFYLCDTNPETTENIFYFCEGDHGLLISESIKTDFFSYNTKFWNYIKQ